MIVFNQLRISDDGSKLYIDAHVNSAPYFKDIYIKRVTICTEEQVRELPCPDHYNEYIFQQEITPYVETKLEPLSEKPIVLSANRVLELVGDNPYGGFELLLPEDTDVLNCIFSGKYATALGTGIDKIPMLVVANNLFNPTTDSLDSENVMFKADGSLYKNEEKGYTYEDGIWRFKVEGCNVGSYQHLYFYLYKQNAQENYEYVRLDATNDMNFLHFFYHAYTKAQEFNNKEIHLMLIPGFMNEKFKGNDFSHNMFFVYIETAGIPAPDTPCRLDETTTLGVTFDYGVFFNQAMNHTRELADSCNVSSQFIDFILNFEALKLSIETEHWIPAINYWKNLTGGIGNTTYRTTKGCGCHG